MRRTARLLPSLGLLVVLLLLPTPLLAHAELVATDPRPNASLVDPPAEVRITFSEPIDPSNAVVDVLDSELRAVDGAGPVQVSGGGTVAIRALPALVPGVYTVSYQVVSTVDGHATAGRFAFGVDPSGAVAPPTTPPTSSSPSVDPWAIGVRWLSLAAALIGLGTLAIWWRSGRDSLAELAPDADRRPPWRLVGATAVGTSVGLAVYLSLAARPILSALPGPQDGLPLDFAAPFGWTGFAIAMRIALLGGLAAAVVALGVLARRRVGAGRGSETGAAVVVAACLALALAGMSAAGHASSLGGPIGAGLDWLHLVAAAAWLGGLPAVYALARRAPPGASGTTARGILRRHGPVALVAGPLVVLTGLANSPVVLGEPRELVAGGYGNLLLAKAGLASLALAIGAANHVALRRVRRSSMGLLIGAELVIAAVAVMAGATMVTIQPGVARQPLLAGASVNPAHHYGEAGPSRIHASVSLPAPGDQSYLVTVSDATRGGPRTDVQEVFIDFSPPPGSGLPSERVELEARDAGLYGTRGAHTPVVGEWGLEVTVRRSDAPDESVAFGLLVMEPDPPRSGPPPDVGVGVPGPIALLWGTLPNGPAGWLPAALAAAGVVGFGLVARRRQDRWLQPVRVGLLVVAVVAVLGAGTRAVVDAANRPTAAELAFHDQGDRATDPRKGERIYRANCTSCHGANGDGDGPVTTLPPSGALREDLRSMSDREVSYRIANGLAGTPMPAFAAVLTEGERWDLVSYLRERWGGE